MKNLCGCLVPGSQLYQPHKIRAFRRFAASRLMSKVTSRVRPGQFVRGPIRRSVSTDGPKKRQQAVVTQVFKPRPSFGVVETFLSAPKISRQWAEVPTLPALSGPLEKSRFLRKTVSYGEILICANSLKSNILDPLSVELALLPTFHSVQQELGSLFCGETPNTEGDTSYAIPVESCSSAMDEKDKQDAESERNRVWQEIKSGCQSNIFEGNSKTEKNPRPQPSPLTFDEVHSFENKESYEGNEDSKKNSTICDLPNLNAPTCPSREFIIHTDRSSVIIHKDLYITNRILDKLKESEKKRETDVGGTSDSTEPVMKMSSTYPTNDLGFTVVDCSDLGGPPVQLEPSFSFPLLPTGALKSKSDTFLPAHSPDPESFMSNVEFRKGSGKGLSSTEASAFNSRKNLYSQFLKNATPCCLIDGLHIKHVDLDTIEKQNQASGNQIFDVASSDLSTNKNAGHEVRFLPSPRVPDKLVPDNELDVQGWAEDLTQNMHENVFIPIGNEIESAVLGTPSEPERIYSIEEFKCCGVTSTGIREGETGGIVNVNDFVNHVNNDKANVREVDELGKGDHSDFEAQEDIESALLKQKESDSSGSRYVHTKGKSPSGTQPPKQKNPNVDVTTETVISCYRSSNNTDINIKETQRYLDKRLPYPFSTETILQVYGTNDALRKATQAVESSKAQLVHLSNANVPNSGTVTPKLQFNHMLSKSHEQADTKKRILKVKVIPVNKNVQEHCPASQTASPQTLSQVLKVSDQSELSCDVSKLVRRGKFKSSAKKMRRSDSAMKLQSKKKLNKDGIENIRILSPKELEKMFPSPPKPKPVEKPRKVTINNKAAKKSKSSSNLVVKKRMNYDPAAWKPKNAKMIVKAKEPHKSMAAAMPKSVAIPSKKPVEVEKEKLPDNKIKTVLKNDEDAGLSPRDQKILKSIISSKVKDSFNAVNMKTGPPHDGKSGEDKNTGKGGDPKLSKGSLLGFGVAVRAMGNKVMSASKESPNPTPPSTSKVEPLKPVGLNVKSGVALANTTKTEEDPGLKSEDRGIEGKPRSLTPAPHREYITIKGETDEMKKAAPTNSQVLLKEEPAQHSASATKNEKPHFKNEPAMPGPTNAVIAEILKKGNTESPPDSRLLGHLPENDFKPKLNEEAEKQFVQNARSKNVKALRENTAPIPEVKGDDPVKSNEAKVKPGSAVAPQRNDVVKNQAGPTNKEWMIPFPTEPLFFPFETPSLKEYVPSAASLASLKPQAPQTLDSVESLYESDFCKLCQEVHAGLEKFCPVSFKVPLTRVKEFPMVNQAKKQQFTRLEQMPISIDPTNDVVLMKTLAHLPAVTKVLGATLSAKSQLALEKWKQGLATTLGDSGFKQFYQNELKRGKAFHSAMKKYLAFGPPKKQLPEDLTYLSMAHILRKITDVCVLESQVVHPVLAYRGVIDCVARYKGKLVAIEWKRSDKSKPTIKHTFDAPLQLSAYIGALNFDKNYKFQVEGGLIVVAYSDGSPADVYELQMEDCEQYWAKWLKRLYQFHVRQ